jgi:hypothetical protein
MTAIQATADVFWTAFRAMSQKEQRAFLERLSRDERALEILEDLRYASIADTRKEESRRSLDDVLAQRARRRGAK